MNLNSSNGLSIIQIEVIVISKVIITSSASCLKTVRVVADNFFVRGISDPRNKCNYIPALESFKQTVGLGT